MLVHEPPLRETPSRNDKPVNRSRSQNRHVERVGDGNLRLLRGQGLRRRLLRQALLRAPPVCLEPSSVLRPHACFAACTPTANSPAGLPCALLTACYVCCHAHRARRASGGTAAKGQAAAAAGTVTGLLHGDHD